MKEFKSRDKQKFEKELAHGGLSARRNPTINEFT
jgi:hypothetical protein